MKNLLLVAALAAVVSGCHTTRVGNRNQTVPHSDRQFFAFAGLARLSDPAGGECGPSGTAFVESEMSVVDYIIGLGLAAVGAAAGIGICSEVEEDEDERRACIAGFASIPPFLISTRTVEYQCNHGGGEVAAPAFSDVTELVRDPVELQQAELGADTGAGL